MPEHRESRKELTGDLERRLIVARALAAEHGAPLGFHDEQDQLDWDRKAQALLRELDARREIERLRAEHQEFVEQLTEALAAHGVPAMPSWREAIDYLATRGGTR